MNRTVNPQDSIDLVLLLQSFGETLGTLYPQAHVYDNNDSEISGSPFDLSLVANNLYTNRNAFQVGDSGTYKVVYLVYTDSGHTTRSSAQGEIQEIIEVKIQSTTGLGGYGSMKNQGGDVIVDTDPFMKEIKKIDKKFTKQYKTLKKAIDGGFKVDMPKMPDIPKFDTKELLNAITEVKTAINSKSDKKIMEAIKKNRSAIIKHKFDKAMFKPMMSNIADSDLRIIRSMKQLKSDLSGTIDMYNGERKKMIKDLNEVNNKKVEEALNKTVNSFLEIANELGEDVRLKLKFTLAGLRTLLYSGKKPKQNFNIKINQNE